MTEQTNQPAPSAGVALLMLDIAVCFVCTIYDLWHTLKTAASVFLGAATALITRCPTLLHASARSQSAKSSLAHLQQACSAASDEHARTKGQLVSLQQQVRRCDTSRCRSAVRAG